MASTENASPQAAGGVVELDTEEEYDAFLANAGDKTVVIDFWAEWCQNCMRLEPVVKKLAEEMPEVLFAKVNVDENDDVVMRLKVNQLPAFHFHQAGKSVVKAPYLEASAAVAEKDEAKAAAIIQKEIAAMAPAVLTLDEDF